MKLFIKIIAIIFMFKLLPYLLLDSKYNDFIIGTIGVKLFYLILIGFIFLVFKLLFRHSRF